MIIGEKIQIIGFIFPIAKNHHEPENMCDTSKTLYKLSNLKIHKESKDIYQHQHYKNTTKS